MGIPYPEMQEMEIFSSMEWDSWATQGRLLKMPQLSDFLNNSFRALSPCSEAPGELVKKNYMIYYFIYDYSEDKQRYPVPAPECKINV